MAARRDSNEQKRERAMCCDIAATVWLAKQLFMAACHQTMVACHQTMVAAGITSLVERAAGKLFLE